MDVHYKLDEIQKGIKKSKQQVKLKSKSQNRFQKLAESKPNPQLPQKMMKSIKYDALSDKNSRFGSPLRVGGADIPDEEN